VRVTSLKILGVTVSDKLSICEQVRQIVSRCAQLLHALRILRCCGIEDNNLQLVFFSSVILGSAWWGYATAADRQRLGGFIRRAVRAGFYPADAPNLHQLVSDGYDALFGRIQANEHHVLRQLLPSTTSHNYGIRSSRHNYTLNIAAEAYTVAFNE